MMYDEEVTRRLDQPRLGSLIAQCMAAEDIPIDVGTLVMDVRALRSKYATAPAPALAAAPAPAPLGGRAWTVPLFALVFTTAMVIAAGGVFLMS
jgi:hypothetical protein